MCLESRNAEPDKTDERLRVQSIHGPQPVTALIETRLDSINKRVTGCPVEQRWEIPHHLGVGVEFREGRTVLRPPPPQDQPGGSHPPTLTRVRLTLLLRFSELSQPR